MQTAAELSLMLRSASNISAPRMQLCGDIPTQSRTVSVELVVGAGLAALFLYSAMKFFRPLVFLYGNLKRARAIGLPMKVVPFPSGAFSFFTFQILRRLKVLKPGTVLHQSLNMGRPDGYGHHKEMGDAFVTVSPAGLTLIVADPKVATHVNNKRAEFPKPPNTGVLINIYGRNVINTDGDAWRLHRRVTGQAFSERLHRAVWQEGVNQARFMMESWHTSNDRNPDSLRVSEIERDALHLALNVITGTAYGYPLRWNEDPQCASPTSLSYRAAVVQFTAHLMPIFLTPRWLLRLARKDSTRGRAWEAYTAFESYMRGMLDRQRARLGAAECTDENLLTALIRSEDQEDEKASKKMTAQEVMGNTFIFLFAGHETTANTLHYSLLLLAQRPDVQQHFLNEVDDIYEKAAQDGRCELDYDLDFSRARWAFAIMSETLRLFTPTGITNKWTATDQPITFEGCTYVIPQGTRISISGTAVHYNPKVWGENVAEWEPSRWIIEDDDGDAPMLERGRPSAQMGSRPNGKSENDAYSGLSHAPFSEQQKQPPRPSSSAFAINFGTASAQGLLIPAKGSFLAFSEGARACIGKRVATVEFVAVMYTLLRHHRVEFEDDWSVERVKKVLSGRKAGSITLQPPEQIPLRFVRR